MSAPADTAERAPGDRLFLPWCLFAALCSSLMWSFPGDETIPYHLAWIALAGCYAIEPWPWRRAVAALSLYTIITGGILIIRAATGVLDWGETAEIPLMSVLMLLVIHNVHRRHTAYASLQRISDRERRLAEQRERLSRMTSHSMRTPATIAMGYVDAMLAQPDDPCALEDLRVVRDELSRLVLAGDRAIRSIRAQEHGAEREIDVAELLHEVADRWSMLADRRWSVVSDDVVFRTSPERLRICLDTLIENAVRYTRDGDSVRLVARMSRGWLSLGVADGGTGLHPLMERAINAGQIVVTLEDEFELRDPRAQTGLGLAMVDELASAVGGHVRASSSEEGGAFISLVLPATPRTTDLLAAAQAGERV